MSISHKQIAHILPIGRDPTNQSFLYVSNQWIVVRNGTKQLHILCDFSYKILLTIEKIVVSIVCCENDNHLLILYYCINGEWNLVEIVDPQTLFCYSQNGGKQLTPSMSFGDVSQFIIRTICENEGDYPLYHLVLGETSREFFGVDFFNRIFKCTLENIVNGWMLKTSVYYVNDHWKVTALAYQSQSLYVGCNDSSLFRISQSKKELIGHVPHGRAIKILPLQQCLYAINEYSQVFHISETTTQALSFQCTKLIQGNDIEHPCIGVVKGHLMTVEGVDAHELGITHTCNDVAWIPSSLLILHMNGTLTKCPLFTATSSPYMNYHSVINQLEVASLTYSTYKEHNQECVNYFCWKNMAESELAKCTIDETSWIVNDDSLQCSITCALPSSVSLLLLHLKDSSGDTLSFQHPVLFRSKVHTFTVKPLHHPLFASIVSISLLFIAFPPVPHQLPVVQRFSLESISLIDLGIPFLSHLHEKEAAFSLPTVMQLHTPPTMTHAMIQRSLPSCENNHTSYQLLPRGNSILVLLKGRDVETLIQARTHIQKRMIENTQNENELWVVDLLGLQQKIDILLDEIKKLELNEECNTSAQMKERIDVTKRLIDMNEDLSQLLM